jgi:colicin import membrane protein
METDLQGDWLKKSIRISFVLHALLIATLFIRETFFPATTQPFIPALKVDLVALPDHLKNERPAPALSAEIEKALDTPVPIEPEAQPDEMVLKPKKAAKKEKDTPKESEQNRKKKMMSSLDRIKALSKIQGEETASKPRLSDVIKGNKISRGSSTSEDAREMDEPSYLDSVRDQLRENWSLPVWLARQKFSAQVQIFIDARGMIRAYRFVQTSGNAAFDQAIKETIQVSQPLVPPPSAMADHFSQRGVVLGFPL